MPFSQKMAYTAAFRKILISFTNLGLKSDNSIAQIYSCRSGPRNGTNTQNVSRRLIRKNSQEPPGAELWGVFLGVYHEDTWGHPSAISENELERTYHFPLGIRTH